MFHFKLYKTHVSLFWYILLLKKKKKTFLEQKMMPVIFSVYRQETCIRWKWATAEREKHSITILLHILYEKCKCIVTLEPVM